MGGKGSGRPGPPIIGGCLEEVWHRYKAGEAIVGIAHTPWAIAKRRSTRCCEPEMALLRPREDQ